MPKLIGMSFVLKQRCRWQILIALSAHINFRRHRKSSTMFRQGDPRSRDRRRQLRPLCLTEKKAKLLLRRGEQFIATKLQRFKNSQHELRVADGLR